MGRFLRTYVGNRCRVMVTRMSLFQVFFVVVCAVSGTAAMAQVAGSSELSTVSDSDLQVRLSSRQSIRFSLADIAANWREVSSKPGAGNRYRLTLRGFATGGPAGSAQVPTRGGWLLVPPGTKPVVHTLSEQWETAGQRPLTIEPTPVITRGAEAFDTGVNEIMVLPGETIPEGYDIPEGARALLNTRGQRTLAAGVSLGELGWWRGHRVVAYRITGVQTDAQGIALQVLKSGAWEVRFEPDNAIAALQIPRQQRRRNSSTNDTRFAAGFLNANLLPQLGTEAAYHGADIPRDEKAAGVRGNKVGTLLGFESLLAVTKTKLHRVSYATLRSRNLLPDVPILESEIRLYQRRYLESLDDGSGAAPYLEVEVPIHMVGDGDNFDGDDFFVFYGLRLRDDVQYTADLGNGLMTIPGAGDPYEYNNEANLYWLAASAPDGAQPWARMASISLPAAVGTPVANYRRTDHIEERVAFRENVPSDTSDRLYFNNFYVNEVSVGLTPIYPPDLSGQPVDISVSAAGHRTTSYSYQVDIVGNGETTLVGNFNSTSLAEVVHDFQVAPVTLLGNNTRITVTPNFASPPFLFLFVNWVEISYDALFSAVSNRVEFNLGNGTGARPLEVTGFADSDLGLFEVTDPRNPVYVQLATENIVTDGASWKLSVMPDQTGAAQRRFFAVGSASSTGIEEFVKFLSKPVLNPIPPLDIVGGDPDLIVVSHPDFLAATDRWVDHRIARSGGTLQVHVVDVEDLFNWYSGGLKSEWAIKRFANHAITEWNSWALMIVGDANENILEKEVLPEARPWSTDWVPTHYHRQKASGFAPELMATDKWYASLEAGSNYPGAPVFPFDVTAPWDMYVGRFPCNNVAELDIMIDKVITVENVQAGQDWRRRGLFIADDEWSNGLGVQAASALTYKFGEVQFGRSERDELAPAWSGGTPVSLDSVVVLLKPYMDEGFPYELPGNGSPPASRNLSSARAYAAANATGPLIQALSGGGIVAHVQIHANPYLLASEIWLEDRRTTSGRHDIDLLANFGKPWFFMGMGCHIADWAQTAVRALNNVANERSISEKMLIKKNSGASAVYASSGFEYISANRDFGEFIFRRWTDNPPSTQSVGSGGGAATPIRSRWMTGELMWAAEADIQAVRTWFPYVEMISQYVILGDPLMMLDAGEAQVVATLQGTPNLEISGEVDLVAIDASNLRSIILEARDEAGIDRVEVIDSNGGDVTNIVVLSEVPGRATGHQLVTYTLAVPVQPYDHSLTINVYDTGGALPGDRHYELILNMPQTAVFLTGGEVLDPTEFSFVVGEPVDLSAQVLSSAQLDDTMTLSLTSESLELSNIVYNFNKGQELTVDFTAVVTTESGDEAHAVVLAINGLATEFVIQAGTKASDIGGVGRVYNFPNPMQDSTQFVYESDAAAGSGQIRIFSVAGRTVAQLSFAHDGVGRSVVPWNGRDSYGDELGNGTYLYRIEIDAPGGRIVSDMQRLVMMR